MYGVLNSKSGSYADVATTPYSISCWTFHIRREAVNDTLQRLEVNGGNVPISHRRSNNERTRLFVGGV